MVDESSPLEILTDTGFLLLYTEYRTHIPFSTPVLQIAEMKIIPEKDKPYLVGLPDSHDIETYSKWSLEPEVKKRKGDRIYKANRIIAPPIKNCPPDVLDIEVIPINNPDDILLTFSITFNRNSFKDNFNRDHWGAKSKAQSYTREWYRELVSKYEFRFY